MRHMQRPDCMLHTSWYVSAFQLWQGTSLFKGALEGAPIPHLTDISCTHAWKAMYFLLVLGAQWQLKCIGLHLLSLRKNSSQERTAAGTTHAACTKSVFHSYSSHVTPKHFQSTQKKKTHPKCHSSLTLINSTEETLDGNKQKLRDRKKYTSI